MKNILTSVKPQDLSTERNRKELVLYAQEWAEEAIAKDQKPREMIKQVYDMGFETSEEFYNKNPSEMGEQEKIAHALFLEAFPLMDKTQNELQESLKKFLPKIGGFPSLLEFGAGVVMAVYLIYQHSDDDKEFQKEGLKQMYKLRKQNPENISLVYFYYLTDRLTVSSFGYQFFGTQNDGENIVSLPENLREYFLKNPTLFCTKLIERELPEIFKTSATNAQMLELWKLAKNDNPNYADGDIGQDIIIPKFLEKYSSNIP